MQKRNKNQCSSLVLGLGVPVALETLFLGTLGCRTVVILTTVKVRAHENGTNAERVRRVIGYNC